MLLKSLPESSELLWGQHYNKATHINKDTLIGKAGGIWTHNTLVQWLSSVYNNSIRYTRWDFTWCSGYPQRSSWGTPTAPGTGIYTPRLKWGLGLGLGFGIGGWDKLSCADQPDDVSSAQMIWPWLGWYNLRGNEPWHSPPPWRQSVPIVKAIPCCIYFNLNIYSTPISLSLTSHSNFSTCTQPLMCGATLLSLIWSALLPFVWMCFDPI